MSEMTTSEWGVDAVCNLFTPEIIASRPSWSKEFLSGKIGSQPEHVKGVSLEGHIELMDEAKIERAFLLAPKMGRAGLPQSWQLEPKIVFDAVQKHPDRFSGIIGIDPFTGMRGVRELETMVKEYGFIGAHSYPHWFELPPDHARFYPFYAKCAELDIPIQMQVGHCLRYSNEYPLPSVGKPSTVDTIACHFPELKIILIENPYFLDLKLELDILDKNKSKLSTLGKILYVCEPVREHAFHEHGDERYWGYTEEEALRYFLTNVQSLGIKIDQIIVRPHPSESANKYDWIFKEFDLPIYAGGKEALFDELLRSEIVVGCESMAMIIGMLAGRRVISCIPPGGSPCKLPQLNIEAMQDLITKPLIKS
jgi:hypothetical protein